MDYVNKRTDAVMNAATFTIGFARRATAYKRSDLLFADVERLKGVADKTGALQIVYAGKAHPKDTEGKQLIEKIFNSRRLLRDKIQVAYLENYSMEIGKIMTAGVDVWLNTPQPPMEASGTSGMKAAVNGVPSFSVLDGWWIEGCIEGLTGWSIGPLDTGPGSSADQGQDAVSLYKKLERHHYAALLQRS